MKRAFRIALYLFMAYCASIVLHELGHFVLGLTTRSSDSQRFGNGTQTPISYGTSW